jgi:hypothetical protein
MKKIATKQYREAQFSGRMEDEERDIRGSAVWPIEDTIELEVETGSGVKLPKTQKVVIVTATVEYFPPHATSYSEEIEDGTINAIRVHAIDENDIDIFPDLPIEDKAVLEKMSAEKAEDFIANQEVKYWSDTIG